MKLRLAIVILAGICLLRADEPVSLLSSRIAGFSPAAPAVKDAPDAEEVAEIARLERLPAIAIPIQDDTLGDAITTIATASGMNFIAPAADRFQERITLTTKVSPWHLLNRLADRYRFTMLFRGGIWEFDRESAGAIVPRVYALKSTNLDVYSASQNSFASVGGNAATAVATPTAADDGGMVFSAHTQKILEDIRELLGIPNTAVVVSDKPGATEVAAGGRDSHGTAPAAKVIYIPDANSLYVACTRAQHQLVAGYIRLIDQPPPQIQIEARFFETSWDPKTVLGINPENFQPKVSLASVQGNLDLKRLTLHDENAILSADDLSLQLNALQTDSQSRLVQSPTVVTANNHEVYFSVGDEEPFVSSNNMYPGVPNGGFGSTTASVSIRRIGTSVNIIPTVFAGEPGKPRRIRLVVRMEVGALKGFRQINAINIPVVTSQKYQYTTYVEDNQALAFGGLSGIGETDDVRKVPLAGDVPLVGYLFKSKARELHQRNLVAYIVARVIEHPAPAALPSVSVSEPRRGQVFPPATSTR